MPGTLPGSGWQAAILDLDGTLVHTLGDFAEALQRMLRDLPEPYARYTVQADAIAPLIGKGSENLIKSLLALINRAPAAIKNGASAIPTDAAKIGRAHV